MTKPIAPSIPIVASIAPIAQRAEAWICDIWGVVHDGVTANRSAVDALQKFRIGGGVVLLLTNAPRPASAVIAQLDRLGVSSNAYDAVLTSGDLTRSLIAERRTEPMHHLGPPRDLGLFEGQAVTFAEIADAGVIVCSGLLDDERETAEDYRQRLIGPAARRVPMICANPDITVARGDRLLPCAGAVAALYETLDGPVIYAGKPHLPIYDKALDMIASAKGKPVPRAAVQAIGDGVNTDIKGAIAAGLPTVFVASPVHMPEPLDDASLARLFAGFPTLPIAAMAGLAW